MDKVLHGTFVIEKEYSAKPEKVFAAFSNPEKKRRWFAEGEGFVVESYELDFRVGGFENSRFRIQGGQSPVEGMSCRNQTFFHVIVPNQRIVFSYTMAFGDNPFSASLGTLEIFPSKKGSKLIFTEQGAYFENADGPRMREQGWNELLRSLGRELELN
jgi:uncharacterized protein YndB with AHSA1/START domain